MYGILLNVIFILLILPGVFMVLVPMAPGIPYMFVMAALYGFIGDFQALTLTNLSVLGGILILSVFMDYFAGILGAKYGGASRKGLLYGFLGLIIGLIIFPPFGGLLGLFAGVLFAEFMIHRNQTRAVKAATGSLFGSITGIVINVLLAILFFILFVIFIVF